MSHIKEIYIEEKLYIQKTYTFFDDTFDIEDILKNHVLAAKYDLAPRIVKIERYSDTCDVLIEYGGIPIRQKLKELDSISQLILARKCFEKIEQLNRLKIVHNDCHTDNIVISEDDDIKFIDFDMSYTITDKNILNMIDKNHFLDSLQTSLKKSRSIQVRAFICVHQDHP